MLKLNTIFVFAAALGLTLPALAKSATVYNCKQIKAGAFGPADKILQVVIPASQTPVVREGQPFRVIISLFKAGSAEPLFSLQGVGTTEDVMFDFAVKGQALSGTIFLDELDQTTLKIGGKTLSFDCGSL